MKEKCECLIRDWFAIQDKHGNLEQVKCNKCGKDLLFSYRSQTLQEIKERVEEEIDKDLNNGKFNEICSNESTFKRYVLQIINDIERGE